jgi:hypothetical protein
MYARRRAAPPRGTHVSSQIPIDHRTLRTVSRGFQPGRQRVSIPNDQRTPRPAHGQPVRRPLEGRAAAGRGTPCSARTRPCTTATPLTSPPGIQPRILVARCFGGVLSVRARNALSEGPIGRPAISGRACSATVRDRRRARCRLPTMRPARRHPPGCARPADRCRGIRAAQSHRG